MFEVIFAICLTVQNVSEPLLILTERSIMAHIAIILSENNLLFAQKIRTLKQSLKPLLMAAILGKLLTKNRQFQMLITFEPFI
jgi:hypothetical protein